MEGLKELTSAFLKGTILNPLWPPLVQDWGLATPTKNFNPYYPRHNKATNFKFCTHIHMIYMIDRNKSPLKFRVK